MSSLDFDEDDEKKLLFVAVESGDGIGLLLKLNDALVTTLASLAMMYEKLFTLAV